VDDDMPTHVPDVVGGAADADLLRFARARIDDCPSRTPDSVEVKDAAVALLADLLTAGLRHGITPADWAAVSALPTSCLDACRQRQLRTSRLATLSPQNQVFVQAGPTHPRGRAR
jgi:hypothetical protein